MAHWLEEYVRTWVDDEDDVSDAGVVETLVMSFVKEAIEKGDRGAALYMYNGWANINARLKEFDCKCRMRISPPSANDDFAR